MRIYLAQHAEAVSGEVDPDRPLTEAGEVEARRVASFLEPREIPVRVVWHSGKTRAARTAEILAKAFPAEEGVRGRAGLDPEDDVQAFKDDLIDRMSDLAVVGHLPFLARLAGVLVTGRDTQTPVTFSHGCVVCLEHGADRAWTVRWMVVPELLGEADAGS